jgi:hypothetical protein
MTEKPVSKKQAFIAGILLFIALPLHAQQINGRFSTAVYGWEKFDTVGVSKSILLGLQNIQVDVSQGGFSLSTSVYGSAQLSDPMGAGGEFRVRAMFAVAERQRTTCGSGCPCSRASASAPSTAATSKCARWKVRVRCSGQRPGSSCMTHRDLSNSFLLGAQATGELSQGTRFGLLRQPRSSGNHEAVARFALQSVMVTISPSSRATQLIGADISRLCGWFVSRRYVRPQPRKDAAGGARRAGPGPRRPDPPRQRHLPRTVPRV